MTPERWQKVKDVLAEAIEVAPVAREAYLSEVCADDADLKKEVESLLEFENGQASLLDESVFSIISQDEFEDNLESFTGKKIGNYKIIRPLGIGGMGAVFLAERSDGEFSQRVALKLIKRGMDSAAVLRRFFNERQILASLEHPNIAHLIDGGTTDDKLPFFVMEYVEGETIIEYVTGKNLALDAKLNLFREVCQAVSYAHQNLVIHRDLKPSNILVTKDGEPKLLDFGIAKLHNPASGGETRTQNFIFTPEYASPEQVRGEKLTTATDVYSLGVILYELLTGTRPHRTASQSISKIIKAVCETEPERPSSVVLRPSLKDKNETSENKGQRTKDKGQETNPKSLRGDLDNIILKALRKEPERRYSSVEQLEEDIRRHQAGLPVTASRDTWSYRASKFVQRNRLGVAAALLILITLLSGLLATLYQRNRAQQRFNDVRQLTNSFLFEFHDAIENLPGSTPARELVVKRALEYLDKLAAETSDDPSLLRELGTAYAEIGQIQGNSYHSNLGDTDGAMKSYQRSLEIRQQLVDTEPSNRELRHELADSYEGIGDMHYTIGDLQKGLESYEKAVAVREKIVAEEPDNLEYRYSLANVLGKRGDISGMEGFPNLGDIPRSLESYRRGVALYEEIVTAAPDNEKFKSGYATMLHFYGMLQSVTGDSRGAIENGRRSVSIFETLIAANPNNAKYETHLMSALVFMRYPLVDENRLEEAAQDARRVIQTMEKQVAADPKNAFARRSLGVSYNALGRTQTEMNEPTAAIENHQKALRIVEEMSADSQNGENQRDLALTREFLANAQSKAGDCTAALNNYRDSLEFYEKAAASDDVGGIYAGIGKCLAATGKLREAVEAFRQTIPPAEKVVSTSPLNVKKQSHLAIYYLEGGRILSRFSQMLAGEEKAKAAAEAGEWLEKSKEIFGEIQSSGKLAKINERFPAEVEQELKILAKK